ncbi:MAG: 50S ribosomal protein L13 [Deferribacteraceae bacterium]|jgi:large subunit ribosomal protein L13|nr:50S ribosomal protein L13 [Deferribacteraceae bacterium]
MKTSWATPGTYEQKWYLIDAQDYVLGRMASRIAMMLMGKHKPIYTPFIDTGDFVVVVNAAKVRYTGTKARSKKYNWHTGYLGGLKERSLSEYLEKDPEEVVRLAVRRMLPKTKMGRQMLSKLKIYAGGEHPHAAQKPVNIEKEA